MPPQITLGGSVGVPGSASVLGFSDIAMPDADHTLTASEAAVFYLQVNGTLTADRTLTLPANNGQSYIVFNNTNGGFGIFINDGTVEVFNGTAALVFYDDSFTDYQTVGAAFAGSRLELNDGAGHTLTLNSATGGSSLQTLVTSSNVIDINNAGTFAAGIASGIRTGFLSFGGVSEFDDPIAGTIDTSFPVCIFNDGGQFDTITIAGGAPTGTFCPIIFLLNFGVTAISFTTGGNVANAGTIPNNCSVAAVWDFNDSVWFIVGGAQPISVNDVTSEVHLNTQITNIFGSTVYVSGWCTTSGSGVGSIEIQLSPDGGTYTTIWRNENTASVDGASVGFAFVFPAGYSCKVNSSGDITGLGGFFITNC
jgi:hypothetical protein